MLVTCNAGSGCGLSYTLDSFTMNLRVPILFFFFLIMNDFIFCTLNSTEKRGCPKICLVMSTFCIILHKENNLKFWFFSEFFYGTLCNNMTCRSDDLSMICVDVRFSPFWFSSKLWRLFEVGHPRFESCLGWLFCMRKLALMLFLSLLPLPKHASTRVTCA